MLRTNLYIGRGTFKDFGTYIGIGTKYIEGNTPCLENLSFWQGLSLYDTNEVENKIKIEAIELVEDGDFPENQNAWLNVGESEINIGSARVFSSAGAISYISQPSIFIIGKLYTISYEVLSTSGQNLTNLGGDIIWNTATVGIKTQTIIATEEVLVFKRPWICDIELANISAIETSGNAYITNSNSIDFNGSNSKATVQFNNDTLIYLDKLEIYYSLDNDTLLKYTTGDVAISGLFEIDIENKIFSLGFDGTNYFNGIVTHVLMYYDNTVDYINFIDFTLSSGSNLEENNKTVNEQDWEFVLIPRFAAIREHKIIDIKI